MFHSPLDGKTLVPRGFLERPFLTLMLENTLRQGGLALNPAVLHAREKGRQEGNRAKKSETPTRGLPFLGLCHHAVPQSLGQ